MACRDGITKNCDERALAETIRVMLEAVEEKHNALKLLFGVDSETTSNNLLQNNIDQFEWVVRNKLYPNFWGRYINGEKRITKSEINYLHDQGCKIVAICVDAKEKLTREQGEIFGKLISVDILELGISKGSAIFLEVKSDEIVTSEYMCGYAAALINEGYTPAFKANTDAKYDFDKEFSIGMQNEKEIFEKCLIWAVAPTIDEYNQMTTSHFIHPDNWRPFAPSAITRKEIAIWQYGKDCHPINDDNDNKTTFNLNLVRNEKIIIEKMF